MGSLFEGESDYPLGQPRSHLRYQLDNHAREVIRQHSIWVQDARPSPVTGRRERHFSARNAIALLPYTALMDPTRAPVMALQDPRLRRVLTALMRSRSLAWSLLGWETDQGLNGLLESIMPSLQKMAWAAGIGALAGGIIGGVGGAGILDAATIPGGAIAGAEIGLTIMGYWQLKDLLIDGAAHLGEFSRLALEAASLAFFAGESEGFSQERDMQDASKLFAAAIGELWFVLEQAIVAWIMKRAFELGGKAVEAAGARSPALQEAIKEAQGHTAKLGAVFNEWLDKNFEKLKAAVEERTKGKVGGDGGGQAASESKAGDGSTPKTEEAIEKPNEHGSPKATSLGKIPNTIKTSSGIDIHPTPGKTTTILGNYRADMKDIIGNQLEYPKTEDFGPKPGGFNVLNVPDELYKSPDQFWNEYNKPWLDQAIQRGDSIVVATQPTKSLLFNEATQQSTGFGREIGYLESQGYIYDAASGQMIKQ